MDKNLKQIKPMLCPVCGKFYFSELTDIDIEQLNMTPNTTQCDRCGGSMIWSKLLIQI